MLAWSSPRERASQQERCMSVEATAADSLVIERTGAGPIVEDEHSPIIEFQDRIEDVLGRGEVVETQLLRDYSQRIFEYLRRDISLTLAWPPTWYIPSQADYRDYWI